MPKCFEKILEQNPGEKSLQAPFAIYIDLECLLKKEQYRGNNNNSNNDNNNNNNNDNNNNNNLEKSYTEKKTKHEPSGWAMFTKFSFDEKENKLDYYREKDCIKKLFKKLKKHAMKIINYEEKDMIPLTYEENKSYKEQETCHICEGKFCVDIDDENFKNREKVKDHCHYTGKFRGAAYSNLNYKLPNNIPIIICNVSYDTHV